ncbi:DUF4377 domain-containing protein [Winogradskyella sediminis]|uniref:Heat shock protein HslJ n=1 Tax=Winogradskyella sediminis TaxID=1382466 RepID=A0A1H1V5V0_9FLAO|nr:DUF4377 domain-containing protein [Winogradskyella sediminis]REG87624.1 heat shock protein HslJ [Winogradskyella sediminis]SDS79871.1 Heat shock protein HslJ [Winogradskyella sediminis]
MKLFNKLPIILFASFLSSCSATKETTATYWVNSSKVNCDAGAGKTTCLQVSTTEHYDNAEWTNFYAPIEGFNFEPGYLQKIKVSETTLNTQTTPADASSISYKLIKVLEKKQDPKLALHDIWATTHINETPIESTSNVPTLEINTTEMRAYGTNGCNNYSGQIKNITANTIKFGAMASTRKMCMDMTIPDRFDKAFNTVSTYKKDGLHLILYNSTGDEVLRFKKVD